MRTNRRRDRSNRNTDSVSGRPVRAAAVTEPSHDRVSVMQADPYRVQQADFTLCTVTGCPAIALPEDWEVVNLDTGAELPMRLCEEHQLAYIRS